ncbi:MAG TPA: cation diffusion facilitator family transporter [Bryobacteraceae bacterium]|jgi:cation diffusion facilitator family transporter|nr:cation diffusion facilitator family transporter [Bryobacteraceae bacterium]
MNIGQRIAAIGMLVSGGLAALKIFAGIVGHSTAVTADGLESASDVFASGFVLLGLTLAAKPADAEHPYGHGRAETLTGLLIGLALTAGGALICFGSLQRLGGPHPPLASWVMWPLGVSIVAKSILASFKFRYGRRMESEALTADAWNDAIDTLSAVVALGAAGLYLLDSRRFMDADHYGGFVVGLIVIAVGVRVARETALQLMDTMPDERRMAEIRAAASTVPGALGIEKCFARKTGLRYHVDLHLEVDPDMTVRQSHAIAHEVRLRVMDSLPWVADVLVHVEPAPGVR